MDAAPLSPEAAPPPQAPASPASPWARLARVVFFRASREDLLALGKPELLAGLLVCWIVGMGRWWDDPSAVWAQRLGLGSLAYVYLLSNFIWLLFLPWRLPGWDRRRTLAYITLTAAPGILYAFPIEMVAPERALSYNVLALDIVALWRVALLYRFFRVLGPVPRFRALCATLMPVCVIAFALLWLGLATGTIQLMGGIRGDAYTEKVAAMTMGLAMLLVYPAMFLALYYPAMVIQRWRGVPLHEEPPPPAV